MLAFSQHAFCPLCTQYWKMNALEVLCPALNLNKPEWANCNHKPNPAHGVLHIKFSWNLATPILSYFPFNHFNIRKAE